MKNDTSIYKKIFNAKKEIGKISKDSKNPFFKSSYLSLNGLIEAVEDVLEKHDLLLLQPLGNGGVSSIIFDTESDDKVESFMMLPNITDPQKLGSAITYFRRYTLQSLLGLQAEDDDGNNAAKPKPIVKVWINDEQYKVLLEPANKKHIQTYLNKFKFRTEQREELEKLLKTK